MPEVSGEPPVVALPAVEERDAPEAADEPQELAASAVRAGWALVPVPDAFGSGLPDGLAAAEFPDVPQVFQVLLEVFRALPAAG